MTSPTAMDDEAFKAAFQEAAMLARSMKAEDGAWRPRGIVIPAGGARMFTCAWVAVRMLRDVLGSSLPIQLWHLGPEEMSPAMAALVAEHGVETVDALALAAAKGMEIGGFELKSFALLHCEFREVLLLDADNVPLLDPAELFAHESFVKTGAVFWPDLISIAASSRIWELCGVPYRAMPSFESGQLAVDRRRALPALTLAWFLNRHSRFVYQHIYGDKDTFLMAWLALGEPFHLVLHPVKRLQGCMCQHHPDGRRMFQHRNLRKWKLHGGNLAIEGFREEDTCLRFLDELNARWTGRVFTPPPRDEELTGLAAELTATRRFRLETVSDGMETVELLDNDLLRRSRGPAANWWLDRAEGDPVLFIGEDAVVNRRFRRLATDYWRSPAPTGREQDLVLTPAPGSSLEATGHNSHSAGTTLRNWLRNYERIPTRQRNA